MINGRKGEHAIPDAFTDPGDRTQAATADRQGSARPVIR